MSWFLSHPDPAAAPEVKDADAGQPTDNKEDEVTSSNDDPPQAEVSVSHKSENTLTDKL